MKTLQKILFVCAMLLSVCPAQDTAGRIVGTITDAQGAAVVGAHIVATNVATGIKNETRSDTSGDFQFPRLPIGAYQVSAEQAGFRRSQTSVERLEINSTLKFDVALEVGAVTEMVEVASRAVGVETVVPTIGQTVTSQSIENLPLNGRNTLTLALLQPGVTPTSDRSCPACNFSVAGSKGDSVTFLLDGGINNNLLDNSVVFNPNPDTIQEFRILTSNYTAEFGRNAGGIVSTVVKSGTNNYHGSLFEYLRNNAMNATPFFNNANGLPAPVLKRNQFGGTLGGPITVPKVVNGKDRLFFFFGWQSQRQSALIQNPSVVTYTPRELTGDFSQSNVSRTGPDAGVVAFLQKYPFFQANPALASRGIIDPTRINTVLQNYIKAGLVPTSASGTLFPQGSQTLNYDEYLGKTDIAITQNDRVSVLLGYRNPLTLAPFSAEGNVPGYPVTTSQKQSFGNISYTRTFTPGLLNEARFTAQRNNTFQNVPAVKLPTPAQLGITGITPDNAVGPTQLRFDSGLRLGFSRGGPTALIDNTFAFMDNLTWIKGHHSLKTGFVYSPFQDNTVYDFYVTGRFRFRSAARNSSGSDLADALFGLPDSYQQFPEAPSNIRSYNIAGFFQDEWKVTPRLTLTLGLRYEYSSPKTDLQGRSFTLALNQQSTRFPKAPEGLLFPGDKGAPTGANFPDKNDWSPRFGFAWAATPKTSVRGGFGFFYDILKGEDNLQFNGQAPFFGYSFFRYPSITGGINSEVQFLIDPYKSTGNVNTFPSRPPPSNLDFGASGFLPIGGSSVFFVDPKLRTPYVMQFNLSVQRELARGLVTEFSYLGSQTRKNTILVEANPFILGTEDRRFDLQKGVEAGDFINMAEFKNGVNGNYNGLTASLTKRMTSSPLGNTFFTLAWTWSHTLNNGEGFRETNSALPAYNWRQFYASGDNDIRHRIVLSGGWDLPFGKSSSKQWVKQTAGGWSLFPIVTFRTGFPLDIFSGGSADDGVPGPSGAGDTDLIKPNLIGGSVTTFDPHRKQKLAGSSGNYYFNPANFVLPDEVAGKFTYGTLGRNAFRGPGRTNVDFAVVKANTFFGERLHSEFRAEAFNILNHTEFSDPQLNMLSGVFGQISTTAAPRILQLALRLKF